MTLFHGSLTPARRATIPSFPRIEAAFGRFLEADLAAVRHAARFSRPAAARFCVVWISRLGNGWIYPILILAVLALWGWRESEKVIVAAALNAGLMHVLYPLIKKKIRRLRPFRVDPRLPCLLKTLDEHSFPSGHAMTLTGVLVPVVLAFPGAAFAAFFMGVSMAWSRVATGHHYPSDVAAGIALGLGLGYPLSLALLSL